MGNTTESGLPLHTLANIALLAGLEMGFNAAGVEVWCDPETLDLRMTFTFGNQAQMRLPQLRTPCEWALSYDEQALCIRDQRTIEMPMEIRFKTPVTELHARFTEALLELADG